MKKFILLALVVSTTAIFSTARAQVSLNINIGAQPRYVPVAYTYESYYQPVVHRAYYAAPRPHVIAKRYYAPARNVVYVKENNWNNRNPRAYRASYGKSNSKHYYKKNVNHFKPKYHKGKGHNNGRR
ncbi:MAG: hypothetical protein EOO87_18490 [Pedobacter sp.]|nr:MAG: hypothetical protein EOO87_18490 [Pedobacter sp.]